jgi:hypothetical protein
MADGGTYGGIYMRLGEASGTVADDQLSATDGTHSGVVLGNAALYAGGPTCMRTDTNTDRTSFPGTSIMALTAMTVGLIFKPTAISGNRQLVTRDADVGGRFWQFRLTGTSLDFIKIIGGVQTVSATSGMSAGVAYLVVASVSSTGTVKLFRNGTLLNSGSITAANYGGSNATNLTVGNRGTASEANDNYFSEAFVIATDLSESRIAAYAAATGL